MLSAKYFEVKDRLGKIPSIVDFYTQGEVDPLLLIQYAGNYYHFLKMIDKEYSGEMTDREEIRRYSEVSQKRRYCKEYNV